MRQLLDSKTINSAKCPESLTQFFIFDTKSPRLAVRVSSGGKKTYVFEAKLKGKTIRIPIGPVKTWKLSEARRKANGYQVTIGQGLDPREVAREKKAQREAEEAAQEAADKKAVQEAISREKYSLDALVGVYIAHLQSQGKDQSAASVKSAFKCHVLSVFPTIALLPASEVTSYHVAEMVRRVFESGKVRQAGALRSHLSAAFTAARKSPFDPTLPSDFIPFEIESNPVDPVPAIPSKAGDRVLSVEELTGYVRQLNGNNLSYMALKLALYAGGQRIAQLIRVETTDYDPVTQTLKLLDPKGKRKDPRVHLLPLGPVAAGIVSVLVDEAKKHGERSLFVSQGSMLHPHTPGKLVKKIAHSLGGDGFNLRDIRRTCETVMVGQLKITSSVLAQVLSHGITGVQAKHYDKYSYTDEKRAALMQWERYLDRLVTGEEEQKVVPIWQGRGQA